MIDHSKPVETVHTCGTDGGNGNLSANVYRQEGDTMNNYELVSSMSHFGTRVEATLPLMTEEFVDELLEGLQKAKALMQKDRAEGKEPRIFFGLSGRVAARWAAARR